MDLSLDPLKSSFTTALSPLDTAPKIDAMREFLREVDQRMQTDEAKAATQEFNQLIEDIAQKRLDRTEAFRRMEQIEREHLQRVVARVDSLETAARILGIDESTLYRKRKKF